MLYSPGMKRTRFNRYLFAATALSLASLSACAKDKDEKGKKVEATKVESKPTPEVVKTPTKDPVVDEAKKDEEAKKIEDTKKVTEAIAELKIELAKEKERWTEEAVASIKTLASTDFKNAEEGLKALMAGAHRKADNVKRDVYRHPLETLTFFGVTLESTVVEMGVGRGWYTSILAPLLAEKGVFVGGTHNPKGPADSMRTVYGMRQVGFFGMSEDLYSKVKTFDLGAEELVIGEADSADVVLAIREMHNWQRGGSIDAKLKAVISVLKPGGTFGVVQHRAKADAVAEESAEQGYLPQAWLVAKIESAGFKLVEASEINANAKDTKDYEDGVWTLPPRLSKGDVDRAKYETIGESDRMTLRFEKPKAK